MRTASREQHGVCITPPGISAARQYIPNRSEVTVAAFFAGMVFLGALFFMLRLPALASAHEMKDLSLEQVGVDEKLGRRIPTDISFRDQTGKSVRLSRYFTGVPVILTLNYYACPTLCPLVFRNLVGTMSKMGGLTLGKDYLVVTVSIDPNETKARAADKSAQTYAMLGGIPDPATAWPFLSGNQPSINALAQAVGIRYSPIGKNDFAHPNVVIIVMPDGRVSRYLYGLEQSPQDLKLALIEAADGRIGNSQMLNKALLYCFHYDPVGRKYVLLASRVMTGAMVLVLTLTLGLMVVLWKREKSGPLQ
jgi:protein SCO1/2